MKKILIALFMVPVIVLLGCSQPSEKQQATTSNQTKPEAEQALPRVAIAGLWIESSTFSPAQTEREAFHPLYGDDLLAYYPFMGVGSAIEPRAEWFPIMKGRAIPGGIVTREAYESLMSEMLAGLKANLPYDGLVLDIHGAMSVVGLKDPEGDQIARVREVVGPDTIISTTMDLHGNVTKRLAHQSDLINCYRLAPHEDAFETKQRAFENLLDRIESGKGRPAYKAWIRVPVLLPGEKTSTRIEPAKSLYAKVWPISAQEGVLEASIWVGYAWADESRNSAYVMVVGDDKAKVTSGAESLAQSFWDVRKEFKFVAPVASLDQALDLAIASEKRPYLISDTGDNPTAGGAGDVTWTLSEILKRPEFKKGSGKSLIYASLPAPKFVKRAVEAGIGAHIEGYAGANVDNRYSGPLYLSGTVEAIRHGDKQAKTEIVLKTGNIDVILTSVRKPYHYARDFTHLGLNPHETDVVVVKIGYLVPELYNMRADWVMALTPGGVDQDLLRLGHKNIIRPMYPYDADMTNPDLSAKLIPLSNQKM